MKLQNGQYRAKPRKIGEGVTTIPVREVEDSVLEVPGNPSCVGLRDSLICTVERAERYRMRVARNITMQVAFLGFMRADGQLLDAGEQARPIDRKRSIANQVNSGNTRNDRAILSQAA